MAYIPYLVGQYSTGLETDLQPWMLPDEAFPELFDAFVYRQVVSKRQGYSQYAIGGKGGATLCESRMVNRITLEPTRAAAGTLVVGNGTAGPYTFRLQNNTATGAKLIRRGTVTISAAGVTSATDNGAGVLSPTAGTIDYTTGDVVITFDAVVGGAVQIFATYDYHPGLPVMGVANFYTSTNARELIVMDTRRVNKYNATTNRLDYIGKTVAITGVSLAAAASVTAVAHGLISNDKVFIYAVQGIQVANLSIINNAEYTVTVTGANTFTIPLNTAAASAWVSGGTVQQIYSGTNSDFFSWVNYPSATNTPRLVFTNNRDVIQVYNGTTITNYVYTIDGAITRLTCLQMFYVKGRLVLSRTTEDGTIQPKRLRISGTAASCDDFRTSATGAGFIDVTDQTWLMGASFNRDDLLQHTQSSSHLMKYTGNDTTPFEMYKIDESRGSDAPFGAITYLNRSTALSPRGIIGSDGYKVQRIDAKIPDYVIDEIDGENFKLCFAGSVDEDRDHYLIHPGPDETKSSQILVTNYDEDNYCVYKIPLSCMGNFIQSFDVTWNDLSIYPTWESFATIYQDWNAFAYNAGQPFSVGGGHKGEIWSLNDEQNQDNPLNIRNITIPTPLISQLPQVTVEVTSDYNNYAEGDYIFFTGLAGMTQLNNKQGFIPDGGIITAGTVFRVTLDDIASAPSAWTSGGQVSKCVPFDVLTKKFNPFVDKGQQVRVGYVYFYINTSDTGLKDVSGNAVPAQLDIDIIVNDQPEVSQRTINGIAVPVKVNFSNNSNEQGTKKWFKCWINQTGKFIQLRLSNHQALTTIHLNGMVFGFSPAGQL